MQCKQPRAYQRSFGLCSVIDMVSLWGAMWCKKVIRSLKPLGYGRDIVCRSQSHRKLVLSACVSLNLASKNRSFTTRVSIRNVSPSHLIGIFPKSFYPSLLAIRIDSWISWFLEPLGVLSTENMVPQTSSTADFASALNQIPRVTLNHFPSPPKRIARPPSLVSHNPNPNTHTPLLRHRDPPIPRTLHILVPRLPQLQDPNIALCPTLLGPIPRKQMRNRQHHLHHR